MSILTKRTIVRAKREAYNAYGVDVTPDETDTLKAMDVALGADIGNNTQPITGASLSNWKEILGARFYTLSLTVPLHGSGAAGTAPRFGDLLVACGMKEVIVPSTSVTYTPTSKPATVAGNDGYLSASVYVYLDGIQAILLGARGSFKVLMPVGELPKIQFDLKGLFSLPTDVALPTNSTYETTHPVAVEDRDFTMNSYEAIISNLEIDMAVGTSAVKSANSTTAINSIEFTGREPVGTFDPLMTLEATNDFWADCLTNQTEMALSTVIGATAGNICTVTAPKCKYTGLTPGDTDGVRVYEAPFALAKNAAGGEDEFSMVFT